MIQAYNFLANAEERTGKCEKIRIIFEIDMLIIKVEPVLYNSSVMNDTLKCDVDVTLNNQDEIHQRISVPSKNVGAIAATPTLVAFMEPFTAIRGWVLYATKS